MLPDSPDKEGDRQRMSDKIRKLAITSPYFLTHLSERVEIEKECLLRELENSSEIDMIRSAVNLIFGITNFFRQRAQGELERVKRENSRLSGRVALLEQDQHETRKQQATADHFENRLSDLQKQYNAEKDRADNNDKDVLKARDQVGAVRIFKSIYF